jgi:hypothetical protein
VQLINYYKSKQTFSRKNYPQPKPLNYNRPWPPPVSANNP